MEQVRLMCLFPWGAGVIIACYFPSAPDVVRKEFSKRKGRMRKSVEQIKTATMVC